MLRNLEHLERYTVRATDGDIGSVVNFLLDDERWVVRYLVVETGGFFEGRKVVISPAFFRQVDWSTHSFHLALTKDKVKNSPGVDADKPVSRQHEQEYYRYYGYRSYWGYHAAWGLGAYPSFLASGPQTTATPTEESDRTAGDIHLRSAKEVCGYHVRGTDEEIGHVEDFIVDDETWEVRYLVIDTSNWWFGKKVLVAPQWASSISWKERTVYVNMSRQAIKDSPAWEPAAGVNREYESRLYDYYGRPVNWADGDGPAVAHGAGPAESNDAAPQPVTTK